MSCERYKKVLIDAVTSGNVLPPDLRAHLDSCASCRAAFDDEHRLLAAVDSGIRKTANAEVPSSLLPTLLAHLAQKPSLGSAKGVPATWCYAAAAAVLLLALLPLGLRQFRSPKPAHDRAADSSAPEINLGSKQELVPASPGFSAQLQVHQKREAAARRISEPHTELGKPEVLVPPDQELLLARYAEALRARPVVLDAGSGSTTSSLGSPIEPIEVAELKLSPLPALALPALPAQ